MAYDGCASAAGKVELFRKANYEDRFAQLTVGVHTFPENNLLFAMRVPAGMSAMFHAPDGRTRCWNKDVPNMQDHEEWWRETIRIEVHAADVCPKPTLPARAILTAPAPYASFERDTPITIQWASADHAKEYRVDLSGSSGTVSSDWQSGTEWTSAGLPEGEYSWSIKARNGAGESRSDSRYFSVIAPPDRARLYTLANFEGEVEWEGGAGFSNEPNAKSYSLELPAGWSARIWRDDNRQESGQDAVRCWSAPVPNLQNHGWHLAVQSIEVYDTDVCGAAEGKVELFRKANYEDRFAQLTVGDHTFPENNLLFALRVPDGMSAMFHAPDGRQRCWNTDVPNMQDHEEWWRETVRIEVFGTDVCRDEPAEQADCSSVQATGPVVFSEPNCLGESEAYLEPGKYNLTDLQDDASSVFVPAGWSARVYEGKDQTGPSVCVPSEGDLWNMARDAYEDGAALNESISSIVVYAQEDCPPAGNGLGESIETETFVNPIDGATYIYIPAGAFTMGTPNVGDVVKPISSYPEQVLTLPGYWIKERQITKGEFAACVIGGACAAAEGQPGQWLDIYEIGDDETATNLTWRQANQYAKWAGGRLPPRPSGRKCAGARTARHALGSDPFPPRLMSLMRDHQSPPGISPYGVVEVANHTWGNGRPLVQAYPYDASDGRENLEEEGARSVTWPCVNRCCQAWYTACHKREGFDPADYENVYTFNGARVVLDDTEGLTDETSATQTRLIAFQEDRCGNIFVVRDGTGWAGD